MGFETQMGGKLPGHLLFARRVKKRAAACLPRSLRSRVCRDDAAEKFAGCRKFSSSFSFTPCLPPHSCICLPTFLMRLSKVQLDLACVACATPINCLAT